MTYNIGNLSIVATGGNTSRTLSARFADIANVLDFGADPTNTTDSTTAL